ncbi:helix-turn-helix domain-containing protein [Hyunsoonleella rubra]|uniref:Helix-turn-helix domain-containing protein n=1 Tax=Hyunsoonleella rubra TaxID=1737062 RepID=A0ABW5T7K4_9FLAO
MVNQAKILQFFCCLVVYGSVSGLFAFSETSQSPIDSLIQKKDADKVLGSKDLLVLYQEAIKEQRHDSVAIFKNLALLNAKLNQPQNSILYTKKYINNTLDFDILNDSAYDTIKASKAYKTIADKFVKKVNFVTFLFFYASLIGFFFMVIINLSGKANTRAKLFISGFVGVHSLFILEFVMYLSNYRYEYPHVYLMAASTALLYGPLLYFYFKSATHNYRFKPLDVLHFVPNIILVLYLFPMYALSGSEKIEIMLELNTSYDINRYVIFISKVISLSVYAVLIRKLQYATKNSEILPNTTQQPIYKWKRTIYRLHVAYVISYVIYGLPVSGILVFTSDFLSYFQVGAMSIMVIYIAYKASVQPSIFTNEFNPVDGLFTKKYQKSGLTKGLSKELKESLVKLLVEDRIYKQSNINLERLSEKLNTTRHNTSQIINEHFDMNFFELINTFRIKEALNIMDNDVHGSLNIIDIAYEVGFNNKVTFNKAFKKETSQTPSEYIQSKLRLRKKLG